MEDYLRKHFLRSDALSIKLDLLARVYETYAELAHGFYSACAMSCAACCTQNVLCTTIEVEFFLRHVESSHRPGLVKKLLSEMSHKRLQPAVTINSLAELCLRSKEIPEIQREEENTACPFLEDSICTVYAARPFACRSMWSQETCRPLGQAVMNPALVSINGAFQQIIEDFDLSGTYGNLLDLVSYLGDPARRSAYKQQADIAPSGRLLGNTPSPGLAVPPQHRAEVMKWLHRLWEKEAAGMPFKEAVLALRAMVA